MDTAFVGSDSLYFPFKYKIGTQDAQVNEYLTVFRLAEQYLIRAEARAQQNNFSGAVDDLNAIRHRAALSNTTASTKDEVLSEILSERKREFFQNGDIVGLISKEQELLMILCHQYLLKKVAAGKQLISYILYR